MRFRLVVRDRRSRAVVYERVFDELSIALGEMARRVETEYFEHLGNAGEQSVDEMVQMHDSFVSLVHGDRVFRVERTNDPVTPR